MRASQHEPTAAGAAPPPLDAAWLRAVCLDVGADDVGFVSVDRPEIEDQRADLLWIFPAVKTLISIGFKVNKDAMRAPPRSFANHEYHAGISEIDRIEYLIVRRLEAEGVRALPSSVGFPMEVLRLPDRKPWIISHKPIAVAAGLGHMGIHRSVIHPRFGSHIVFGTVLIDAPVTKQGQELDYNPCLECKLCVAVCPTGAIHPDGYFDFTACYTHNYREMMGGFNDWVETIAASKGAFDYRAAVEPAETASMWQSLAYAPGYKSGYCVAVCPAGEDVIGPYLADHKAYRAEVLRPLQEQEEPVYVVPGSDAEAYVERRYPNKRIRRVGNGMGAFIGSGSIAAFVEFSPHVFQRRAAKGLDLTYHFTFTGEEQVETTVRIRDGSLESTYGHHGVADLHVRADTRTWLKFLAGERSILWALVTRRVRLRGPLQLLKTLGRVLLPG